MTKEDLKPNQLRDVINPPNDSESLYPEPKKLHRKRTVDFEILKNLAGRSIVNIGDFTRLEVIELCRLASMLESVEISPYKPLDGKIVITAFFEASTRTRTSFESSVLRLDGKIISIPDGQLTGTKKGESLEDIGEMFNAYGDLVIMRHTETNAPERLMQNLRIPFINAGNGTGEHPTQALADWYALLKWRPALATDQIKSKIHLGILGTPGSMRAVKSFLLMSLLFREHISKITVISEMADPFGEETLICLNKAGIQYEVISDIQDRLPKLDVIYMNSIAFLGDSYKNMDARFKLSSESNLKKNAVILHPLARLDELDTSLDHTSHNLYWTQAHGAVFMRQALLTSVFGRLGHLPEPLITEPK
ncbi:MAG: aspartate carbamoyltransferase [Verrucomicrobiota bacterium]